MPLLRRFWAMDERGIDHDGRFYRVHLRPTVEVRPPLRDGHPRLPGRRERPDDPRGRAGGRRPGRPPDLDARVPRRGGAAGPGGRRGGGRAAPPATSRSPDTSSAPCTRTRPSRGTRRGHRSPSTRSSAPTRRSWSCTGSRRTCRNIRAAWEQRDQAAMIAAVPDEMVDAMACAGTPDQVRQQFAARFAGVYDSTLLYSPSFGLTTRAVSGEPRRDHRNFRRRLTNRWSSGPFAGCRAALGSAGLPMVILGGIPRLGAPGAVRRPYPKRTATRSEYDAFASSLLVAICAPTA